jgi:hypothetical protein
MNRFIIVLIIILFFSSCAEEQLGSYDNRLDKPTEPATNLVQLTSLIDSNISNYTILTLDSKLDELNENLDTAIIFESLSSSGGLIKCFDNDSVFVEQGYFSIFLKNNGKWTIQKFSRCYSYPKFLLANFKIDPRNYEDLKIYSYRDTVDNVAPKLLTDSNGVTHFPGITLLYKYYNLHFIIGSRYYSKERIIDSDMNKTYNPSWYQENIDSPLWKLIQQLEKLSNDSLFEKNE